MSEHRNIVRIDIESSGTHGWQVRITRHRQRHTKFFSDSVHGGNEAALKAAIKYRDNKLAELPDPLPGALLAAQARSKSGVAGIRLGNDQGTLRIEADAYSQEHGRRVRSFSLGKWGLRKALWKACVWKAAAFGGEADQDVVNDMYDRAYPNLVKQIEKIEAKKKRRRGRPRKDEAAS